jgi:hypothetical protein
MRSGKRLVRLTPLDAAPFHRQLGTAKGDFVVPEDLNDPLPVDILAVFEK